MSAEQVIDLTAEEIRSDLAPMVREGTIIAINRTINRNTETGAPTKLREAIARRISSELVNPGRWMKSRLRAAPSTLSSTHRCALDFVPRAGSLGRRSADLHREEGQQLRAEAFRPSCGSYVED